MFLSVLSVFICLATAALVCFGLPWSAFGLLWSALVYIDLIDLPWTVSDHHRMVLNAQTYNWIWMGWKSVYASLLRAELRNVTDMADISV